MCTEPGKAVIAIPCSDLQTFFGSDEKKAGVTYLGPFCVNSLAVMNAVCALDPTLVCRAPGVAIHRTGRRIAAMVHRRRLAQESVVRATILSSVHLSRRTPGEVRTRAGRTWRWMDRRKLGAATPAEEGSAPSCRCRLITT